MSLIEKLRDWGESLFTSKKAYIAQQSLPTESFVSQVRVPNDEGNHSYISPIDGWVQYMPTNGSATNVQLHYQNVHSVMASGTPFTFYGFVPVQKGVAVLARSSGDSGVLLFIRSIGGGDNKILQAVGGGLCHLSQSFNRFSIYSLRSLKQSGSAIKQCLLQVPFTSTVFRVTVLKLRLLMAMRLSKVTSILSLQNFFLTELKLLQTAIKGLGQVSLSQSEKGQMLLTIRGFRVQQTLFSLEQSARLNPCFEGGAL